MADALWLAAAGPVEEDPARPVPTAPPTTTPPVWAGAEGRAAPRGLPRPDGPAQAGPAPEPGVPLYEDLPIGPAPAGRPVRVAAARTLPHALELGRALRPFKRRHPRGARQALDMGATLREYARTGEFVPVLGPMPEPWFDVVVLVDAHPTMEVWGGTLDDFVSLLEGSGAFHAIRRLRLTTGGDPVVITDARGRTVPHGRVTAPGRRRLVLVLSDCAAPGWREPAVWQLLRRWGAGHQVVLLNPLPTRLWNGTALDLPAVRVRHREPAARNTELSYDLPLVVGALFGTDPGWLPLPTLALTPRSIRHWADGVMRGATAGYEAVLVPASGLLASPFAHHAQPDPDPAGQAAVFLHTAAPAAKRLAALSSPFSRLSLPLLHLIRQAAVPEATVSDLAELLTSGLLDVRTAEAGPALLTYRDSARAVLAAHLTRHDARIVQAALSRHIAARSPLGSGRGLAAIAVQDVRALPPDLRPFAHASNEMLALLDGERRPAAAVSDARPPLPAEPMPADGPMPTEEDNEPDFPDPRRSAALFIGVDNYRTLPPVPAAHQAVLEMRALLTSESSWNLSPEHCRVLLNPESVEEVLRAVRDAGRLAEDALLVYFVGHCALEQEIYHHLMLDDTTSLSVDRLGDADVLGAVRQAVFVLDLFGRPTGDSRLPLMQRTVQTGKDVQVLMCHGEHAATSTDRLPRALTELASTGVRNAPELLSIGDIAGVLRGHRPVEHDFLGIDHRSTIALLRNPQAPGFVEPALRGIFDEVCLAIRGLLVALYPARVFDEVHRVLLALITFTHGHTASSVQALEADLRAFLAPGLSLVQGTRRDHADLYCLVPGGTVRLPVNLRTVHRRRGLSPLDIMVTKSVGAPIEVTIVLDRSRGTRDAGLFNLSPRIGLVGGGDPTTTLVLRMPFEDLDSETEPTLETSLREALANACEDLLGGTLNVNEHHGWTVPHVLGADEATIASVELDDSTVEWNVTESYEHGTVLAEVRVAADVILEAFVFKSDLYIMDAVTVLDPDVNDHMAEVAVAVRMELVYQAQIDGPDHQIRLEMDDLTVIR
ncbi:SAV_2336 N-terminal domain-related protein [Kitasatospora sp. NPDC056800]|uniref:SAV_2336 N-terminal domain-related protein n=1 Tax=Kitasatospora sp. NPDC056800 TaxID=3345948 RepID=UPI003683BBA9